MKIVNKFKNKVKNYKQNRIDLAKYKKDLEKYNRLNSDHRFDINELSPVLTDYRKEAGTIGGYFWQDLWGAKSVLRDIKPGVVHYDIGSRVDGFIAHLLSAGIEVCLIDVRPLDINCEGLDFICSDATKLDNLRANSIDSISALCSIEHFGLGRYNDPIVPDGSFLAFKEIQRVVKVGGRVYISLPVGIDSVLFNEERIFKAQTVVESFDKMKLIEYSVMHETIENSEGRSHTFDWNCTINKYDDYTGKMKTGFFVFEKVTE